MDSDARKQWRAANPKKAREAGRRHDESVRSDPKRLRRRKKKQKEWAQRNAQKRYEQNKRLRALHPKRYKAAAKRSHASLMADPTRLVRKRRQARENQRRRRKEEADKVRSGKLFAAYGITLDEYRVRHSAQDGLCAICGRPETATRRGKTMQLAVDHCHDTGRVRGLLCSRCNIGLGYFKHDLARLKSAMKYLRATG